MVSISRVCGLGKQSSHGELSFCPANKLNTHQMKQSLALKVVMQPCNKLALETLQTVSCNRSLAEHHWKTMEAQHLQALEGLWGTFWLVSKHDIMILLDLHITPQQHSYQQSLHMCLSFEQTKHAAWVRVDSPAERTHSVPLHPTVRRLTGVPIPACTTKLVTRPSRYAYTSGKRVW